MLLSLAGSGWVGRRRGQREVTVQGWFRRLIQVCWNLPMCPRALLGYTRGRKAGRDWGPWRGPCSPAWSPGRRFWSQSLETLPGGNICARGRSRLQAGVSHGRFGMSVMPLRQDSGPPLGQRQLTVLAGLSQHQPTNTDAYHFQCIWLPYSLRACSLCRHTHLTKVHSLTGPVH